MKYLPYVFLLLIFCSCGGKKYQNIPYFKNLTPDSVSSEFSTVAPSLTIQKGDAFGMDVSSQNTIASALFSNSNSGVASTSESGANSSKTYLVDAEGNIRIPLAGSVKIEGLTLIEARTKLESSLQTYLRDPIVNLKLINFRISVIGDVASPGSYNINNETVNLVEAIALAGDLNITAQRNNILVIREIENKRNYIRMDLQNKNIFNSPYFYLKSGDILYVQPGELKYRSVDNPYQNVSLILSIASFATLLYFQFIR